MDNPPSSPDPTTGPDGFPNFRDGDVLITSGFGKSWKLHSTVLRTASRAFRTLFDKHAPRHITRRQAEEGKTIKWKIEMIELDQSPEDTRFRSFRVIDEKAKPTFNVLQHINGIGADVAFPMIYDNFFRCVYNLPPNLSNAHANEGAYFILDSLSLLQAAEYIHGVNSVRLVVEAHLLRLSQYLWGHIENNPEAWTDVAVRLQSPIIFREGMIHIVGRLYLRDGIRKEFLLEQSHGKTIMELAHKKADELKDKKLSVERRLMEFYPRKMVHSETATDVPGRSIYATDIYLWQALTIVRQYLSSAYMANKHHRCWDGGVQLYRCIGEGSKAYLRKDTLDRFHQSFGMSTKGKQCLQVGVDFIKDQLRPIVEDLLVDRLQLTSTYEEAKEMPYLTCAEILDEELPWVVQAVAEAAFLAQADADHMED